MYRYQIEVHLSDTDVTGQVYYARPLEWMEWCRVAWFQEKFGNFMKHVEATGITFFPSKINVDYRKPVFFGDKLEIHMASKNIKKVSFTLDYEIKRGDEAVLKAEIVMVCFDNFNKKLGKIEGEMMGYITAISV